MVEALQSQLDQAAKALKAQPEHLVRKLEQLVEERERLAARVAEMVKGGGAGSSTGEDARNQRSDRDPGGQPRRESR
jgi:hypothetical protein